MFHKKKRESLKPLASFYIAHMVRPCVTKTKPLYVEFSKRIVNSGLLKSKDGREAWISSTTYNRAQRFTKTPKKGA